MMDIVSRYTTATLTSLKIGAMIQNATVDDFSFLSSKPGITLRYRKERFLFALIYHEEQTVYPYD
jgi:hypothetical protein